MAMGAGHAHGESSTPPAGDERELERERLNDEACG